MKFVVKKLFPTPPLPLMTRFSCLFMECCVRWCDGRWRHEGRGFANVPRAVRSQELVTVVMAPRRTPVAEHYLNRTVVAQQCLLVRTRIGHVSVNGSDIVAVVRSRRGRNCLMCPPRPSPPARAMPPG